VAQWHLTGSIAKSKRLGGLLRKSSVGQTDRLAEPGFLTSGYTSADLKRSDLAMPWSFQGDPLVQMILDERIELWPITGNFINTQAFQGMRIFQPLAGFMQKIIRAQVHLVS